MMANKTVKISDIDIPKGKREIDRGAVIKMASSIAEVGLLHPIIISKDMKLISGQHRLEAMKLNKEVMIEVRVANILFDDDMVVVIELDENDSRSELSFKDKFALVEEITRRKDERKNNGNNQYVKVDSLGNPKESKKEKNSKYRAKKEKEIKAAKFSSVDQYDSISRILKRGTEELIEAVEAKNISVNKGYTIAILPKDEQNVELENIKKGIPLKKIKNKQKIAEDKNTVEEKKIKVKEQDKFGAYVNVKIYTGDIKRTSNNIAKCFGNGFEKVYGLLLHEMVTGLRAGKNQDSDVLYSSYSYGMKALSDGEISEIKKLFASGVQAKDIEEMYDISSYLIGSVRKIIKEQDNGN